MMVRRYTRAITKYIFFHVFHFTFSTNIHATVILLTYPLKVHLADQKRANPAAIKKNHAVQTPVRLLVANSLEAAMATVYIIERPRKERKKNNDCQRDREKE